MGCLRNGAAVGTLNGKSQGIKQQSERLWTSTLRS